MWTLCLISVSLQTSTPLIPVLLSCLVSMQFWFAIKSALITRKLKHESLFYVLLTAHPCIILQISPTTCTILRNIFIFLLYMFRASVCPSWGENYCINATLVFVTLYVWRLVCGLDRNPTSRPDANHTEWQIPVSHRYSNSFLMMDTYPTSRPDATYTEWQIPVSHRYSNFLLMMGTYPTSRPDVTHTEWQIPVSHRYSNFLLMMDAWMPETCREEK